MLPGRVGQPAQAHLHITLAQLRDGPGASGVEAAWAAARASQPGWLTGPDADAAACDATLVPIVTGHVDWTALDRVTEFYLAAHGLRLESVETPDDPSAPSLASHGMGADGSSSQDSGDNRGGEDGPDNTRSRDRAGADGGAPAGPVGGSPGRGVLSASRQPSGRRHHPGRPHHPGRTATSDGCGCTCGGCTCRGRRSLSPQTVRRLRETMLRLAADALSGPGGLASWLRQSQLAGGPGDGPGLPLGIPLPLDIGEAEPTIPAHLRRAATARHAHCAFPGCRVPAEACHIHHLVPRARGGPTTLGNLVPACSFHHLTAIHRWGWTLTLHADGSTTATSPDRTRTLRDHGPPGCTRPGTGPPQRPAQPPWAAAWPSSGPDPLRSPGGQRPAAVSGTR